MVVACRRGTLSKKKRRICVIQKAGSGRELTAATQSAQRREEG